MTTDDNVSIFSESEITDYVGNKVYKDGSLKMILIDGGYIQDGNYYYYLTDHLGNNRVVADASGKIIQKTHYEPFGKAFEEEGLEKQPYLYNGKEYDGKHGLNLYDYSARLYSVNDETFPTPDPHRKNYYSWSPYVYVGNNPMRITDPTGMDWVMRVVDEVHEIYYDRSVTSQDDVNSKYETKAGVAHMGDGSTLTQYDKDGNIKSQYTFTNDAKNNKYGTVTDMNGDMLNSNEIQYGSNYTIFGTSDNSVNAETLHKNFFPRARTSYTGPNNPKDYLGNDSYQYQPRNTSEYAAMQHDQDYDALNAKGSTDALTNFATQPADAQLAANSLRAVFYNNSVKDRMRVAAVYEAFSTIANYKYPIYKARKTASNTAVRNIYSSQIKFGW